VTAGTVFRTSPGQDAPDQSETSRCWPGPFSLQPRPRSSASAFLAYKDKAQWIWFAAFSLVAGFGGLTVLQTIGAWRLAAQG
jgi:hypothetical protein